MNQRILIVEDEMTIAMMIEDMIIELGHEPYAIASRLGAALAVAESGEFDLAILDVNLDGHGSAPVARVLALRGIPFFFATGYGAAGVDTEFAGAPVVSKPFVIGDLQQAISTAMTRKR